MAAIQLSPMPIAAINNQQIHYTDTGDGPVIIATHATLMDVVSLEPLTSKLVADGYRVVAFDLRGHGRTVYDQQPYTYMDVAGDVIGLADHLGIDRFIFLGEGQGAVVALRTALLAPRRVEALVLIGPTADAPSAGENAALETAMDLWCTIGPTSSIWAPVSRYATATPADAEALMARWRASAWRDYRPAADTLAKRPRFVEQLPAITCPTLVIHGTGDFYVPIQFGQEVADNLSGPTAFMPVETSNQAITMAFHPRVAAEILDWLSGIRDDTQ